MANTDKITTAEALELAKQQGVSVTKVTMNEWCKPEGLNIGIKIGGRWYVSKKRLLWVLEGKAWKIIQDEKKKNQKK